jgi:glycosyltransferase involved in cell wall biosynthesis
VSAERTPAISVVVPVYNVEAFLAECLDSLLAQTFEDFEVLLVNDGSTDGSQAVIDRYTDADSERFRSFIKPNGGLADARNFGMERALGEYLAFVDADDELEPDFLESLHSVAQGRGADLVISGIVGFVDDCEPIPYIPEPDMSVFGVGLAHEPRLLYRVDASACDKLYARELFERAGIGFPVGMAFEDVPTTYRLLAHAHRVEKVDRPMYRYRQERTGSITADYGSRYLDLVEGFRMIDDYYAERDLLEGNRVALLRLHLTHLVAGRYPDFFLRAGAAARGAFVEAAFALLDERFPGWVREQVCRDLWPSPLLRAVSTHRVLLKVFCRLPRRVTLGILSRTGAFDPSR